MTRRHTDRLALPAPAADPVPADLAASWYAGLSTARLRDRPVALQLFGRDLVAWRERSGRAVVAPRYCPHQGVSLALGKVDEIGLRCPFHGWRFDGSGACVRIPGSARIPATAKLTPYPTVERYGYVWVWYGTAEPLFSLPDFPALAENRDRYVGFRYTDRSTGTARQLLENAFDYYHFQTLHGLSLDHTEFRMLRDQSEAADNGSPIDSPAWLGAWFEGIATPGHPVRDPARWGMAKAATFAAGDAFQLLVDGWPGGQRFTGYVDGKEFFKVLLAITPVSERVTTQVGWAGTPRTGRLRTLFNLVMLYGQSRAGTRQDIPIYDTTEATAGTLRTPYDNGVAHFRRYYQSWVGKVETVTAPVRSLS
ncbi:Rieske 2Fe-2S domain-containing protein [Micromonospora sp. NPDC020750]|uniref:Rieske 2Fe-2S domain-containing protein n=1 Tax=unclassified Micromonospora TaxID=2617518 RepID=UPI003790A61D